MIARAGFRKLPEFENDSMIRNLRQNFCVRLQRTGNTHYGSLALGDSVKKIVSKISDDLRIIALLGECTDKFLETQGGDGDTHLWGRFRRGIAGEPIGAG